MMQTQTIEGEMARLRTQIKQRWSKLTDADLDDLTAMRLVERLQARYEWTKERAQAEVGEFLREVNEQSDEWRAQAEEKVEAAQRRAEAKAEAYEGELSAAAPEEVTEVVNRYSMVAVVVAFAAGILIGALFSPRA